MFLPARTLLFHKQREAFALLTSVLLLLELTTALAFTPSAPLKRQEFRTSRSPISLRPPQSPLPSRGSRVAMGVSTSPVSAHLPAGGEHHTCRSLFVVLDMACRGLGKQ